MRRVAIVLMAGLLAFSAPAAGQTNPPPPNQQDDDDRGGIGPGQVGLGLLALALIAGVVILATKKDKTPVSP